MMRMRVVCRLLTCLCIGVALSGCVPVRAKMIDDIKGYVLPADVITGEGLIYVIDTSPALLSLSKTVLLDGEDDAARIGSLSSGTYIYVHVPPGYHRVKIPQWSPYELVVEVEEGDILFLSPVTDQRQKKNSLIQVDGVVGRYYIKHSKSGEMARPAGH
jgi:hypothetical protein